MVLTITPPLSLLLAVFFFFFFSIVPVIFSYNLLRNYHVPSMLYILPITFAITSQGGSYSILADAETEACEYITFKLHSLKTVELGFKSRLLALKAHVFFISISFTEVTCSAFLTLKKTWVRQAGAWCRISVIPNCLWRFLFNHSFRLGYTCMCCFSETIFEIRLSVFDQLVPNFFSHKGDLMYGVHLIWNLSSFFQSYICYKDRNVFKIIKFSEPSFRSHFESCYKLWIAFQRSL